MVKVIKMRGNKTLLTVGDVRALEAELEADLRRRAELDEQIMEKQKRLAAAKLFLPEINSTTAEAAAPRARVAAQRRPAKRETRARRAGRMTWTQGVVNVLHGQSSGISHVDLLAELRKTELGEHVSKGAKGFYQAIKRLHDGGAIVKSGGLIYSARLASKLKESGQPVHERVVGRGGSNTIVLGILNDHPQGLSAPELKEMAARHPDAPASIRVHKHYIYNVLSILKKDGVITNENGKYRLVTKPQGGVH